jgi:hypothetical protein
MRDHQHETPAPTGYSSPRLCGSFGQGHDIHYIPATRSSNVPHVQGKLALVSGKLIIIDFGGGDFKSYYNHHPRRLLSIIKIGGTVGIPEGYGSILRSRGGDCFSILPAEEEWVPCDQKRPRLTRFRPPQKTAVGKSRLPTPDLSPVTVPILHAVRRWFPGSGDNVRSELAFAIAHDALHVEHVKGGVWMASIRVEPPEIEPTDNTLVEQIHATIRSWFHHHPAAECWELAEEIAFGVLDANHVLGELWAVHVPTDGKVNR